LSTQKQKSRRGEHGRRPTFGTNELIFTETKVVSWGMLYTIVYYRFKKEIKIITTNNTKIKRKKNTKKKLWSQKEVQKKI